MAPEINLIGARNLELKLKIQILIILLILILLLQKFSESLLTSRTSKRKKIETAKFAFLALQHYFPFFFTKATDVFQESVTSRSLCINSEVYPVRIKSSK